jgi:hypothetical protein
LPGRSIATSEKLVGANFSLPSCIRLAEAFGFIDEFGDRWHWESGQVVSNPFVIAMLIERVAPFNLVKA